MLYSFSALSISSWFSWSFPAVWASYFLPSVSIFVAFWFTVELMAENRMSSMKALPMRLSLNSSSINSHFCVSVLALLMKSSKDSLDLC